MHFTFILTGFVVLLLGSSDPVLAVSLGLPRSSPIEHHRTVRQVAWANQESSSQGGSDPSDCADHPREDCDKSTLVREHCSILCSAGRCPSTSGTSSGPWFNNQGNCYYFSSLADGSTTVPNANWDTALENCRTLALTYSTGGIVRLAELGDPDNLRSDAWLMEQIKENDKQVWLGAKNTGNNGQWYWNNVPSRRSLSIDDPYWAPNEPQQCQTQGCQNCLSTIKLGYRSPQRQYFNDANCNSEMHFVCQLFNKDM